MLITAVLAAVLVLPFALNGLPQPESTLPDLVSSNTESADEGPSQGTGEKEGAAEGAADSSGEPPSDELEYAPSSVLARIADGTSLDEVNARLSDIDYVLTESVSEDDVTFGYVKLDLAEGVTPEDAIERLRFEDFTSSVQPDYVYHLLDEGDYSAYASPVESTVENGVVIGFQPATSADLVAQSTSVNDELSKSDAENANTHWMLDAIKAYEAWDHVNARGNHKVTVAVLDSGVNVNHDDLKGNIVGAYSAINDSDNVADTNGHGTHVAGIVAAEANNVIGVAGVSYNANIMPVQVIQSNGNAFESDVIKGIDYVIKHQNDIPNAPVRVVNMSFGGWYSGEIQAEEGYEVGDTSPGAFLAAINALQADDVDILVVCAAGNYADKDNHKSNGTSIADTAYKCYPCDFDPDAIGVINLDHSGTRYYRATGSNFNMRDQNTKELSAPGTGIYSTVKGGGYQSMSGTSMATPCVSGVAAMLFAANPQLSAADAKSALISSATKLSAADFDLQTGYGMVNAAAAIDAVAPNTAPLLSGDDKIQVGESTMFSVSNSASAWAWTSSNTDFATVSGGSVVGVGAGSAVITATSDNVTLQKTVNVYDPAILGGDSILVGTVAQFSVSADNPAGTWTWKSSDPEVISVYDSSAGLLYGKKSGRATITVTLADDPTISSSIEMTVTSSNIAYATVSGIEDQKWTGEAIELSNLVVRMYSAAGGVTGYVTLRKGTDYEVTYADNVDIGTATVSVKGKGDYAGEYTDTFRIGKHTLSEATTARVNQTSVTYTGSALEPGVTIVIDGKTLVPSTDGGLTGDYTLEYANNVNKSTATAPATVKVVGTGDYVGEGTLEFSVAALPITSSAITVSGISNKTYTGAAQTQTPTLKYNGMTLQEGKDFELSYSNNTNAGTATMRIRGLGNYETYTYVLFIPQYVYRAETFTINPANLSAASASFGSYTYNGSAQKPTPTVTFNGATLTAGTDYAIAYPSDCTNAGTKQVTLTARSSNFTGSKTSQYTIGKRSATITANSKSKAYDGTALTGTAAGYTTSGFVNSDLRAVSLSGAITNAGSIASTVSGYTLANGSTSNYSVTTKNGTLTVNAFPLSSCAVSLSSTSFTYTGKAITPTVTVKRGTTTLRNGTDYTVVYSNNSNVGTGSALITGKGNYTGTKSATFTISKGVLETFAGADRYATAQKIASAAAAATSSVKGVIVCSCNEGRFPDALSAAGLSGVLGYPVVTVNGNGLTQSDRTALTAMKNKCSGSLDIIIVGGTPAVSASVQSALGAYGKVSARLAGSDRYATNAAVYSYGASHGGWSSSYAFLARGDNFPDALAIAPYLAWSGCPIVLISPSASSLTNAQQSVFASASQAIALGSDVAVPSRLLSQAASASKGRSSARLGGSDRYVTAARIVEWEVARGMKIEGAGIATGRNFPDSLASSALLGSSGSVLCLVNYGSVSPSMTSVLQSAKSSQGVPTVLRVFGSEAAVSRTAYSQVSAAVGWPSYGTRQR